MKIQIISHTSNHIQLWPMESVKNHLCDLGIKFVKSNPDMILYHTYKESADAKQKFNKIEIPIMLLERIASARILSRTRISKSNVVGVLKSTIYRDLNLDNSNYEIEKLEYPEKKFKNNYHSKLIYESLKIPRKWNYPYPIISNESFNKIELWYNFGCYEMMIPYINYDKWLSNNRLIDIGFIGTTQYGPHSNAITMHRKKCLYELHKLKCNKEIKSHRIPGKKNYYHHIWNSKIGISPWGLGEKCYRDFEIIYGGGILIKPDTSFILDWTDTYNLDNEYYVPCKIDFSDVSDITEHILSNWDHYDNFRKSSRDRLIKQCFNSQKIANHIRDVFIRCSNRIK